MSILIRLGTYYFSRLLRCEKSLPNTMKNAIFSRTRMKNVSGFSLLEVLLAVLIVGVSVPVLLSLQGVLSRGVSTTHALIERIPYIRSYFVEADKEKLYEGEKFHKKVIEDPSLTMTYSAVKPTSRKFRGFENLLLERVKAQWPTILGTRTETFTKVRFFIKKEKA